MRWAVKQQEKAVWIKNNQAYHCFDGEKNIGSFDGVCYRPEKLDFDEDSAY